MAQIVQAAQSSIMVHVNKEVDEIKSRQFNVESTFKHILMQSEAVKNSSEGGMNKLHNEMEDHKIKMQALFNSLDQSTRMELT